MLAKNVNDDADILNERSALGLFASSGTPPRLLPHKMPRLVRGIFLPVSIVRIEIIQRLIHRQLTEHDDLRDAQHRAASRTFQQAGEITGHDLGRGQRLSEI